MATVDAMESSFKMNIFFGVAALLHLFPVMTPFCFCCSSTGQSQQLSPTHAVHHSGVYIESLCRLMDIAVFPALHTLETRITRNCVVKELLDKELARSKVHIFAIR